MAQANLGDLVGRADAYLKGADVLLSGDDLVLTQNALESMHLALELAMKAVIVKNGSKYPDHGWAGHDLSGLTLVKFKNGKDSILSIAKALGDTGKFNIGLSAWSMDCRYKTMITYDDMKLSINAYKELYKWIKSNFL
jgi:hypothetical protein